MVLDLSWSGEENREDMEKSAEDIKGAKKRYVYS
jgi:hypothetical protein